MQSSLQPIECTLIFVRHLTDEDGSCPFHPCQPYLQFIIRSEQGSDYVNLKSDNIGQPNDLFKHTDFLSRCKRLFRFHLQNNSTACSIEWVFDLTCSWNETLQQRELLKKKFFSDEVIAKFKKAVEQSLL